MAADPKYDMAVYPTAGLVRSASDGARTHQVTLASCDCADFINRKGRLIEVDGIMAVTVCKHNAEFLERVGGWNRPAEPKPAPQVHSDLTRVQAFGFLVDTEGADVTVGAANAVLNSVMEGQPAFIPAIGRKPCVKVAVTGRAVKDRRYTITLPA